MKILIVSQFFYPESFRINGLAEALRSRGHQVTVLTGQPNYPQGEIYPGYDNFSRWRENHEGIEIYRVPILPRKKNSNLFLLLNYLSFVISACLFGIFRVGRHDVCLVWSSSPISSALPAVLYKSLYRVPMAIWVQDLWPESFTAITKVRAPFFITPLHKLVQFIYKRCDQIWVQSQAFEASVTAHGGAREKIQFVPNWAEDFYDRKSSVQNLPEAIPETLDGFSILFAGNFGKAQSLPTLLAAAELLRENSQLRWYLVGDGSMFHWLVAEIEKRKLGGTVVLLKSRPPEAMPALFKRAKVLLVSLADDPVFALTIPSKIQSYLASGKPLLASMNGEGARLIRESGCGLVAAAEDANGLALRVQELLTLSEQELSSMGERAYQLFDSEFRMRSLIERTENLLVSLKDGES